MIDTSLGFLHENDLAVKKVSIDFPIFWGERCLIGDDMRVINLQDDFAFVKRSLGEDALALNAGWFYSYVWHGGFYYGGALSVSLVDVDCSRLAQREQNTHHCNQNNADDPDNSYGAPPTQLMRCSKKYHHQDYFYE